MSCNLAIKEQALCRESTRTLSIFSLSRLPASLLTCISWSFPVEYTYNATSCSRSLRYLSISPPPPLLYKRSSVYSLQYSLISPLPCSPHTTMQFLARVYLCLLPLACVVSAHGRIKYPRPLNAMPDTIAGNPYNSPYKSDGSEFPCKVKHFPHLPPSSRTICKPTYI